MGCRQCPEEDKHGVAAAEAEQVFFNPSLLPLEDVKHSQDEPRAHALGHPQDGFLRHITFTLRGVGTLIRVITARDMRRMERAIHEQAT